MGLSLESIKQFLFDENKISIIEKYFHWLGLLLLLFLKPLYYYILDRRNYKKYIIKQLENTRLSKNQLVNNTSIEFDKSYYPQNLITVPSILDASEEKITNCTISNIFKPEHKCIIIESDTGTGKSMLVTYLLRSALKQKKPPLIILLDLKSLNNTDILEIEEKKVTVNLKNLLIKVCLDNEIRTKTEKVLKMFKNKEIIFLLDGLDEVLPEKLDQIISQINEFTNLNNKSKFIITSRPGTSVGYLNKFQRFKIDSFDITKIKDFILKQLLTIKDKPTAEILAEKIMDSINETSRMDILKSYMNSPLMLCLYIKVYINNQKALVPKNKTSFYNLVLENLYQDHDNTKPGYKRIRKINLSFLELKKILAYHSYKTSFENSYDWDLNELSDKLNTIKQELDITFNTEDFINEMQFSIQIWQKKDNKISFIHRSFQEYLTAEYICRSSNNPDIYRKLIDRASMDRTLSPNILPHFNLLDMCQELDTSNYNKYFVIPFLNNTYEKLAKLENRELAEATFGLYNSQSKIGVYNSLSREPVKNKIFYGSGYTSIASPGSFLLNHLEVSFDAVRFMQLLQKFTNPTIINFYVNGKFIDSFWEECGNEILEILTPLKSLLSNKLKVLQNSYN